MRWFNSANGLLYNGFLQKVASKKMQKVVQNSNEALLKALKSQVLWYIICNSALFFVSLQAN